MGNFWKTSGGAAVISAGGSLLSGLAGGLFAGRQQRRQYKYNLKLQKQQQKWQRQMWEMENLYNLPKNEVRRLLDAGINPALAFSNGGAAAAPVPQSGSAGGVSAPTVDFGNAGAAAVSAAQSAQQVQNDTAVAQSVVERNEAEAAKLRTDADESRSRKALNDILYKIQNNPEYIAALQEAPVIQNNISKIDRNMKDLGYSFDLETYGIRVDSASLSLDQQRLSYITSAANLRNIIRSYDRIGAYIEFLETGSEVNRGRAAVLRQDLDIRAGKAFLGTLERDALAYCQEHGVRDSVTNEIRSFVPALADEYAAGVDANIYSSRASAISSNQDAIYQGAHGQERRGLETELIRRQGNWYRTNQWTQSINCASDFVGTVIDAAGTIVTRGMSKAGNLITSKTGSERLPLSPEAAEVLRSVYSESKKRLIY